MNNTEDRKGYYLDLVNEIKKYHDEANSSVWDDAYTLFEIIRSEEYKKEFCTRTDFATYLNVSKATLSTYYRAVLFDKQYDFDKTVFSLGRVYLLSTLGSQFEEFKKYTDENSIDYVNASQKELRRIIKQFRDGDIVRNDSSKGKEESQSDLPSRMHKVYYKNKCIMQYDFSCLKDHNKEEMTELLREFLNNLTDLLIEPQMTDKENKIWEGNERLKLLWEEVKENEKEMTDDLFQIVPTVDKKMKEILSPQKYALWEKLKKEEEELFDTIYDVNNLDTILSFINPDGTSSLFPGI